MFSNFALYGKGKVGKDISDISHFFALLIFAKYRSKTVPRMFS